VKKSNKAFQWFPYSLLKTTRAYPKRKSNPSPPGPFTSFLHYLFPSPFLPISNSVGSFGPSLAIASSSGYYWSNSSGTFTLAGSKMLINCSAFTTPASETKSVVVPRNEFANKNDLHSVSPSRWRDASTKAH